MKRHLIPAAVALLAFALAGPARADVRVSLAPDDTPVTVSTPTGYTATITADSPTLVHDAVIMIPGHGAPCGQPDELGEPYGADATSNFVVLTSGVLVSGRFVTFPGEWTVTPEAPLTFHLDVLAPPLAACFYAGSTISSDAPVTGLAQGAEMDVQQSSAFATSGSWLQVAPRRYQLAWRATSTDQGHRVAKWRLGLPAGFSLVSSTLGAAKQRLSPSSLSLVWSTPRPLDDAETVVVDAPCGIGTIHARLRLERDDGLITGTGNTGPGLDLPPC